MEDGIVVVLMLFIVYLQLHHHWEVIRLEDRYFRERQMLLDRLMAVDFATFKQGEMISREPVPTIAQEYPDISEVGV